MTGEFDGHRAAVIHLRHGDCFDVLKDIGDDSVALVLTDPPYG